MNIIFLIVSATFCLAPLCFSASDESSTARKPEERSFMTDCFDQGKFPPASLNDDLVLLEASISTMKQDLATSVSHMDARLSRTCDGPTRRFGGRRIQRSR